MGYFGCRGLGYIGLLSAEGFGLPFGLPNEGTWSITWKLGLCRVYVGFGAFRGKGLQNSG